MRRLPPLNAIRVFEAAARYENFTQAANELGLTQTAVSHQIRLLEERLGLPLFARAKGRVSLSEAGRRIAPQLGAAFDAMDEAFGALALDDAGLLSITTTNTFGTVWLAARLGSFQVGHQELAVRLSTDRRLTDFSTGEFHAAIRMGRGGWPRLRQHFLFRLHYSPICSPEFVARHRLERPEQLLDVPRFSPTADWWRDWLAGAGVAVPAPEALPAHALELDNQQLEANAALAGAGIAMLTPFLFRADLAAGRLVQPFEHVHYSPRSHWLVYPEAKRVQPKIAAFRDWLQRLLAEASGGEPAEAFVEPPA
jgi:LysR family transcriptional regulator, glycine cleavage system transcriptional activator